MNCCFHLKSVGYVVERVHNYHTPFHHGYDNKSTNIDHQGSGYAVKQEIDLFSRLPDEILRRIISCLSMKDAIKTSILCSKLMSIWKSVDKIQINFQEILKSIDCYIPYWYIDLRLWTVADKIHKTLSRIEYSTKVFKLEVGKISSISDKIHILIDSTAQFCLDHYVEDAALNFDLDPHWGILFSRSSCKVILEIGFFLPVRSLRSLSVYGCKIKLSSIESLMQPSFLRTLVLTEVYIPGKDIEELISKCPLLTSLTLHSHSPYSNPITINHSKLMHLVIKVHMGLKLNAPSLKVLVFSNWLYFGMRPYGLRVYDFKDASSLIKCRFQCSKKFFQPLGNLMWLALYDLRHVRTIQLDHNCIKGLPLCDTSVTSIAEDFSFSKLKLSLEDVGIEARSIAKVLVIFSRIQKLTIRMEENCCLQRNGKWKVLEKALSGMEQLKEVSVHDYRKAIDKLSHKNKCYWRFAFQKEFKMIRIMMRSVKSLEKLTVHVRKEAAKRSPMSFITALSSHFQRMENLARASSSATLELIFV